MRPVSHRPGWRALAVEIRTEREQEACFGSRKSDRQRRGNRDSGGARRAGNRLHSRRPSRTVPAQRSIGACSRRLVAAHRGRLSLLPGPAAASRRVARVYRHGSSAQANVRPAFLEEPVLTASKSCHHLRFDSVRFRTPALQAPDGDHGDRDESDTQYPVWPDHIALVGGAAIPVVVDVATATAGPVMGCPHSQCSRTTRTRKAHAPNPTMSSAGTAKSNDLMTLRPWSSDSCLENHCA